MSEETLTREQWNEYWGVRVDINGVNVLTIESDMLAGNPQMTTAEKRLIADAGLQVLSFVDHACPSCAAKDRDLADLRGRTCETCRHVFVCGPDEVSCHLMPMGSAGWLPKGFGCTLHQPAALKGTTP